jgi:hypothetical protein
MRIQFKKLQDSGGLLPPPTEQELEELSERIRRLSEKYDIDKKLEQYNERRG